MGKIYRLEASQLIDASMEAVWDFFTSAANLQKITPAYMKMRITSGDLPEHVYPGQVIMYTLKPVLGIPLSWMTEITQVVPHKMFVDEQRSGPYKIWHHEHHFEEQNGKVLMHDIVHYQLPLGIVGRVAHSLFVKKQLRDIFAYRRKRIGEIFKA